MPQLQPMPLFLNETAGADRGPICSYQLQAHGPAREVTADGLVQALAQPDTVTWLHFNLSDARVRRWLLDALKSSDELRQRMRTGISAASGAAGSHSRSCSGGACCEPLSSIDEL